MKRENEGEKKVNKLRQRFSPHRNWYDDCETVDCDVCGNERDKNTGGSKQALITMLRKKGGGGREKQTQVISC